MNVDDLTINGLGFSAERPLKKRKFDLTACMQELLEQGIIELGLGQTEVRDLFLKRGTGLYVVQFFEGSYFRRPLSDRSQGHQKTITDDPLYQPLRTIGVDEAAIRRLFKKHARGLIQRWVRVADAAMNEKPRGFSGFKISPAAFLIDAIQNERMPPEWIYAHEKEQRDREWEQNRRSRTAKSSDQQLRYQSAREAALREYLSSTEGKTHLAAYEPLFQEFYRQVDPMRYEEAARKAALDKIERENFQFPEFGSWLFEQRAASGR